MFRRYCSTRFSASPGNQSAGPASHAAKGWSIQYSPIMPSTRTVGGPGTWYFDFPTDPNYPACVYNPDTLCHSVNYVTNSYSGPATHSVSMTFQILTTGTPTFEYVLEPDNTCPTPATVRLFLQRRNDLASFSLRSWNQKAETKACKGYWHWRGATRLASSRATASPYICLTECCTAIRLLRDAFVARLEGSLESSAR
jgi:hypothetical protein